MEAQEIFDTVAKHLFAQGRQEGDLVYLDAWGQSCRAPILCWECDGRGTQWAETCVMCGGYGKVCDKDAPLYDSRNPNHGRIGGLRKSMPIPNGTDA